MTPPLKFNVLPQVWHDRPRTRGDCEDAPRPCPWVGCRHHLAIDVRDNYTGKIHGHFAGVLEGDLSGMTQTCSLDVSDQGEHTLEQVAKYSGVTRQRVEAIEHVAQARARAHRLAGEAKAEWRSLLTRK